MTLTYKRMLLFMGFIVLPILFADVNGADPRLTGTPGEDAAVCTQCHTGTKLSGDPAISITVQN